MTSLKLTDNLYLVEVAIPGPATKKTTKTSAAKNHLWIFDRSGSMAGSIQQVVEHMITDLRCIQPQDTVTIGWFSGEGQRDYIVKGASINDHTLPGITRTLRQNASTIGCTCFSEVLSDLGTVVKDLAAINPLFALVFFTDGHPVVSNYTKEIAAIDTAINAIKGQLASVLLVGYGDYYNKELMGHMANQLGGSLVHADNLSEYGDSVDEFLEATKDVTGRHQVKSIPNGLHGLNFALNGKTAAVYVPDANGDVNVTTTRSGGITYYAIVKDPPFESAFMDRESALQKLSIQRALYAAALIYTQRTKTDIALEILGAVGDVALIDGVTNAYTNAEYGRVETAIRKAIASPKGRFTRGRNICYLPPRDAFCLLDVMALLAEDDIAAFAPNCPGFEYQRIGVKTNARSSAPVFQPDPDATMPIDTLTWHSTRLNLSLTGRIPGSVELDARAAKHGFAPKYPTHIWRSYTVVKDGRLNMPTLPVVVSDKTYAKLTSLGLVFQMWKQGAPTMIDLTKVPVINRAAADNLTSARNLGLLAIQELRLENQVKILRHVKTTLESAGRKDAAARAVLTDAQKQYLAEFHIGVNGFNPPVDAVEATDKYAAKEFDIKIAKFSAIPKIVETLAKHADGKKKLTPSEQLLVDSYHAVSGRVKLDSLTAVNAELAVTLCNLRTTRKAIQKAKFAILLGKRWFDEFNTREENTLDVDGYSLTFTLREIEVPI